MEQFPDSSWLQIVRANPIKENNTVFYEVYASYLRSISDDQMVLLGRLIGYNHYVGDGLMIRRMWRMYWDMTAGRSASPAVRPVW